MIKSVIFDLDDTLISERKYIESGYRHISKLISTKYGKSESEVYQLLFTMFKQNPQNVFNRTFDKLNLEYTRDDITEFVVEYRNHLPTIEFFSDVIPNLEELNKNRIKMGIITDGYSKAQRQKLVAVKAMDLFDEIIITDELGSGSEYWKPHPKSFELMKEKMNIEFVEMVYVGDNINKDFITPNRLGIRTIQIRREDGIYIEREKERSKIYYANHIINSLDELINKL